MSIIGFNAGASNNMQQVNWRRLMTPYSQDTVGELGLMAGSVAGGAAGYYGAASAALHGSVSMPVEVLGLVGAGVGIYRGVQALRTTVSAQDVNECLKPANNGQDVDAAQAAQLAENLTHRMRLSGALKIGSAVLFGAALLTGQPALGVAALVAGVGTLGYSGYNMMRTGSEVYEIVGRPVTTKTP